MNTIGAQIITKVGKDKSKDKSQPSDQAMDANKTAAAAAKVKVNISADTERGEAGIVAAGVAIPPTGIANKSNLAMAGGNILGDKSSFLK
jgi:hypothetical protein